jgi:Domain of unknown function (DUF4333)
LSALLALFGAASLFASCGVTHRTLDAASVEREIAQQVATRYSIPAPTVKCPSGVRQTKGQTFICTATIEGQTLHLEGTVGAGGGQFTVAPREAIISVSSQTARLADDIASHTHTAPRVDCGPHTVLIVPVGHTFTCTATFPGEPPRPVTVKVLDLRGDFSYTLSAARP